MSGLVKGLLDYSRIGRKKTVVPISTQEIISDVLDDLGDMIIENNAKIHTQEQLPDIQGFEIELRLLFQNLIQNAIKFRKPNVSLEIHIYGEEKAHHWEFAVQDNGIGIAQENQDKIFILYKSLHNKDDYEGYGIGLAHCKKITELHLGNIWVKSAPNQGSIFYFTISKHL